MKSFRKLMLAGLFACALTVSAISPYRGLSKTAGPDMDFRSFLNLF